MNAGGLDNPPPRLGVGTVAQPAPVSKDIVNLVGRERPSVRAQSKNPGAGNPPLALLMASAATNGRSAAASSSIKRSRASVT
jgi:hypothetical protein